MDHFLLVERQQKADFYCLPFPLPQAYENVELCVVSFHEALTLTHAFTVAPTMGAPEPFGTQVDSRVRFIYCLDHMQIQGLDSLEEFPVPLFEHPLFSMGDIHVIEYFTVLFPD